MLLLRSKSFESVCFGGVRQLPTVETVLPVEIYRTGFYPVLVESSSRIESLEKSGCACCGRRRRGRGVLTYAGIELRLNNLVGFDGDSDEGICDGEQ